MGSLGFTLWLASANHYGLMHLNLSYADLHLLAPGTWCSRVLVAVLQLAEISCRQIVLLQNTISVTSPIVLSFSSMIKI